MVAAVRTFLPRKSQRGASAPLVQGLREVLSEGGAAFAGGLDAAVAARG